MKPVRNFVVSKWFNMIGKVTVLMIVLVIIYLKLSDSSLIQSKTETESSPQLLSKQITTPEDRLQEFYNRMAKADVKYCNDKTMLMPDCKICIPGLEKSTPLGSCDKFIKTSNDIRNEISDLTKNRYGSNTNPLRPYGLYPYLELPDFVSRQIKFGKMLSEQNFNHVIDIGSYYNPINLFFDNSTYCPISIIIIEPILDALSAHLPCQTTTNNMDQYTHVIILPITFKHYIEIKSLLPPLRTVLLHVPLAVVCIGCDSHYGPNRKMLETSFPRPYTLFLEYPSEYVHNAAFRKMMGGNTDQGEKLLFHHKFQPDTNLTQYTKRVMKVIQYTDVIV